MGHHVGLLHAWGGRGAGLIRAWGIGLLLTCLWGQGLGHGVWGPHMPVGAGLRAWGLGPSHAFGGRA